MSIHFTDKKGLILLSVILAVCLLYLLSPILTPFLISFFLAYIGDPVVNRLEAMRLSRTLSVIVFFVLMLILGLFFLLLIFPLIEEQTRRLLLRLPEIMDWIQMELIPTVSQRFGITVENVGLDKIKQSLTDHWQTLGSVVGIFLSYVSTSGQRVLLWISYLLLIPVVTFYLLIDWDYIIAKIKMLIPARYKSVCVKLAKDSDAVLSEFFRGQLSIMLAQGAIYSIGLWIVGLDLFLLIGMTAGMISFVPYLGAIIGILMASVAAFMQFHEAIYIVFVLIVFGVGQVLESMILSPLLIGDRIGLHPVAVIFAVMAGAQLFGLFGMLIALPVAAVLVVVLRHFHERYLNSRFYIP